MILQFTVTPPLVIHLHHQIKVAFLSPSEKLHCGVSIITITVLREESAVDNNMKLVHHLPVAAFGITLMKYQIHHRVKAVGGLNEAALVFFF